MERFSKQTSVHGLNNIGFPKQHFIERVLWFLIVIAATAAAISLTLTNWTRYNENPTVVSIEKDFRNWYNPFPAVTGCFTSKVDISKATKYIAKKWNIGSSDKKFKYYLDFIEVIGNISYQNLNDFLLYENDSNLIDLDMFDTAVKVHPDLSGTLVTFDTKRKSNWALIMSEVGICFSVNSKFSHIIAYESITNISSENEHMLTCHYLNGLCYARYDSDPMLPIKYYIHSYLDIVHATSDLPLVVKESEELEINYRMQQTSSSPSLRYLSPSQRKCRFHDEPILDYVPAYSNSFCVIICRYKLALKLCGCKPFFYHFLHGKVCDIKGLVCLSKYAARLTSSPSHLGCDCPQPCDIIKYLPQVPKMTKWYCCFRR